MFLFLLFSFVQACVTLSAAGGDSDSFTVMFIRGVDEEPNATRVVSSVVLSSILSRP